MDMANKVKLLNCTDGHLSKMWLLWDSVGGTYNALTFVKPSWWWEHKWTTKIHVRCAEYMYWLNLFNTINWCDTTHVDHGMTIPHRLSKHSQSYSGLRPPGWSYSTYLCHNHFVIIIFLTFLFKVKIYQVVSVQIVVVDDDDDHYLSSLTITITTTITLLKGLT